MTKLSEIRNFKDLKTYVLDNKEKLKTVVLPLMVAAAVLFFWFIGSEEPISSGTENSQIQTENTESEDISIDNLDSSKVIYVDIGGEVKKPGVYEATSDTRLFEIIEKAGGLTDKADIDAINRAEIVFDGQKITIGSIDDKSITNSGDGGDSSDNNSSKVNINTADSITLQTIPGIGPSKAERIIEYRTSYGSFKKIEDIKNITGIGDKTFESLKEYICVS